MDLQTKENDNQQNIPSPLSPIIGKEMIKETREEECVERIESSTNIDFILLTPEITPSAGEEPVGERIETVMLESESAVAIVSSEGVTSSNLSEECASKESLVSPIVEEVPPTWTLTEAPTEPSTETVSEVPPEAPVTENAGGFYDVLEDGIMNGRVEIQVSGRKVASTHVEYFLRLQVTQPDPT
jgi:hypothetical protein